MAVLSIGYDSWRPHLSTLNDSLSAVGSDRLKRDARSQVYVSVPFSWIVPSARWMWVDGGYSRFEAETASEDLEIEWGRFELTGSLYMHLFWPTLQIGAGPTVVNVEVDDRQVGTGAKDDRRFWGGHFTVGVACPMPTRIRFHDLGLCASLRCSRLQKMSPVRGVRVGLSGLDARIGIAWIPEGESWILNW